MLQENLGRPKGCKEYLKILELAAEDSEVQVDEALRALLESGIEEINAERIETMLGFHRGDTVRELPSTSDSLTSCAEVRKVLQ